MVKTLTLSKPIEAHGQEITELTFRDGTTQDIISCGYPATFYLDEDDSSVSEVKINQHAVAKLIVNLAGIPKSSMLSLAPQDFMAAGELVMGFFGVPGAKDKSATKTKSES